MRSKVKGNVFVQLSFYILYTHSVLLVTNICQLSKLVKGLVLLGYISQLNFNKSFFFWQKIE